MAGREGRFVGDVNQDLVGKVQTTKGPIDIGLFYEQVDDGFILRIFEWLLTRDLERVKSSNINGGIYSEEMGLGKTVEVFALILLNQSPERSSLPSYFSESLSTDVNPVSTTLIVAPETLLNNGSTKLLYMLLLSEFILT
ncbi:hypothetical protein L7F22_056003 [Adiantum nelumboides]|nr:hypothetical protein [Adiantum nelumboides]